MKPKTEAGRKLLAALRGFSDDVDVARDRLAVKHGVEAGSRYHGHRKSLALILAESGKLGDALKKG